MYMPQIGVNLVSRLSRFLPTRWPSPQQVATHGVCGAGGCFLAIGASRMDPPVVNLPTNSILVTLARSRVQLGEGASFVPGDAVFFARERQNGHGLLCRVHGHAGVLFYLRSDVAVLVRGSDIQRIHQSLRAKKNGDQRAVHLVANAYAEKLPVCSLIPRVLYDG